MADKDNNFDDNINDTISQQSGRDLTAAEALEQFNIFTQSSDADLSAKQYGGQEKIFDNEEDPGVLENAALGEFGQQSGEGESVANLNNSGFSPAALSIQPQPINSETQETPAQAFEELEIERQGPLDVRTGGQPEQAAQQTADGLVQTLETSTTSLVSEGNTFNAADSVANSAGVAALGFTVTNSIPGSGQPGAISSTVSDSSTTIAAVEGDDTLAEDNTVEDNTSTPVAETNPTEPTSVDAVIDSSAGTVTPPPATAALAASSSAASSPVVSTPVFEQPAFEQSTPAQHSVISTPAVTGNNPPAETVSTVLNDEVFAEEVVNSTTQQNASQEDNNVDDNQENTTEEENAQGTEETTDSNTNSDAGSDTTNNPDTDSDSGTTTPPPPVSNIIKGTRYEDTLTTNDSGQTVIARAGDDQVQGGAGEDILKGGAGDDTMSGGDGNDVLKGDQGDDTLSGGKGNDRLHGNRGNDTLIGGEGDDQLRGGKGDDILKGEAGDDTIHGGSGNDTAVFTGSRAEYTITEGRNGTFTISHNDDGLDGTDTVRNVENFTFSDGTLTAGQLIVPEPEVDITDVAPATSNLEVRLSNETDRQNTINSSKGHTLDAATTYGEAQSVAGKTMGLRGDITYSQADASSIDITLDSSWNKIKNVEISSDGAADVTVDNFVHADVTLGNGGDSTVTIDDAKRGNISTGNGNDTIDIDALTNNGGWSNTFNVSSGDGNDSITISGDKGHTISNIDAGAGNDTVTVDGDYEAAEINLGSGDDTAIGGSGEDTFTGGDGSDTIIGGDGADTAIFTGTLAEYSVTENESGGYTVTHNNDGADGADTISGVETLQFADGSYTPMAAVEATAPAPEPEPVTPPVVDDSDTTGDTFTPPEIIVCDDDKGAAHLTSNGKDALVGTDADEVLCGGNGKDVMDGGAGNDQLHGDNGKDTLTGGQGNDVLLGGNGVDTAIYASDITDYSIRANDDGSYSVRHDSTANDNEGIDTLYDIEQMQFADGTFDMDEALAAGNSWDAVIEASISVGGETVLEVATDNPLNDDSISADLSLLETSSGPDELPVVVAM